MKCPRCQRANPSKARFCMACGAGLAHPGRSKARAASISRRKPPKSEGPHIQDLEKRLAEGLQREAAAAKREAEALEQQAATSEILRVIASSPTDLQAVLDTVAENAARLCEANDAQIFRVDQDVLRLVSGYGPLPKQSLGEARPIDRGSVVGRAVVDRRTIYVHDLAAEPDAEFPYGKSYQRRFGHRTMVSTPLLRKGTPIGGLSIRRMEVRPFSDQQIKLLETFADQAVIAIENVRLFTELQTSNRDLTTALDTQTATSDILRVISRSQTDVQPVFDAIMASAARLLRAHSGTLTRIVDSRIGLAAMTTSEPSAEEALRANFPMSLDSGTAHALTLRTRAPLNVIDTDTDPRLIEAGRRTARARGYRSQLVVPMLRQDEAIGTISLTRSEPGGFTDDEIALLTTFADQAVIAVENVRLFTELQHKNQALTQAHAQVSEALGQQTATSEILRVIASSPTDVQPVFDAILASAVRLCQGNYGGVYRYDGQAIDCVALHNVPPEAAAYIARTHPRPPMGLMSLALHERGIMHSADVVNDPRVASARRGERAENVEVARETRRLIGFNAIVIAPMLREGMPIGVIVVTRREGGFTSQQLALLQTFAAQAVIAIENVRLFTELRARNREVEEKSRELAAASQHKSEFLANMSHELRTPLNAVIGFSEVLNERMFGDLNEKQAEYLKDIHASGQHLLSLINDILDLSKIEAGRMELELTNFDLPAALDNALTLVRERAGRRGISLDLTVDERLDQIRADERKVRQVVLNLLSNAIKFTPDGGRIELRAVPVDGSVEVSVSDTGIGIAPEDQEAIFEEFKQVGTSDKKVEGTGLGLALSRKFVELHGGRIWVKSQVGQGSTFTFTIPMSQGE